MPRGSDQSIFLRNVPGSTERFAGACVGVAGCGGLGSNVAVCLARAGVGRLILVDDDEVEPSNLNRQHYFRKDVGTRKVEALARHLRAIDPGIDLVLHDRTLGPGDVGDVFGEAGILVEAFDRAEAKRWLIDRWCSLYPDRPLVCGNGIGGCGRSAEVGVTRIGRVHFCGDGATDMSEGLCSARVALVASMQANVTLALLMGVEP